MRKLIAAAGMVLVGVSVLALRAAEGPATQPAAATAPATAPADGLHEVKKGSLKIEVTGDGSFQAVDPVEIKLKLKAYAGPLVIQEVAAPGKAVKKGDLLLALEDTHMRWSLQGAESEYAVARSALQKAEADAALGQKADKLALRMQEDATKQAHESLEWWKKMEGPQTLKIAELQLKNAKDNVGDQEDELDQLRKMYKSEELTNATADIVLKRAIRRLETSRITMQIAGERTEKSTKYDYPIQTQRYVNGVEQADQALEALKTAQAAAEVKRQAALTAARIGLEQAQRKLDEIKQDAAQFRVTAPADGVVAYGNVENGAWQGGDEKSLRVGEKVAADRVLMRVVTPGKLCVEMSLPENKAFVVREGMKAKVSPAAVPGVTYDGRCAAPVATPRASPPGVGFELTVNLDQADTRLLAGMKCSVKIDGGTLDGVLLVPLSAVTDGQVTVQLADGKKETRDVTVGQTDGKMAQITSGLKEGEKVVKK